MTEELCDSFGNGLGLFAIVHRKSCSEARKLLEKYELYDPTRRIEKWHEEDDMMAVPLKKSVIYNDSTEISLRNMIFSQKWMKISPSQASSKRKIISPRHTLISNLENFVSSSGVLKWDSELSKDVAQKWEKHGDLVILPQRSFTDSRWLHLGPQLWHVIAESLKAQRLARRVGPVTNDEFRSPRVVLLLGDDPVAEHVDMSIRYTFDITKCMFSVGNITEKQRISGFDCHGEVVLDLYAGIGYFTLPYLVHAKALRVHACEWNPSSVTSLKRNLTLNGVHDRCIIHFGDNRKVCPHDFADRVNLGLLPDSEPGWEIACKSLRSTTGGILHVHGVADVKKNGLWRLEWAEVVRGKIQDILRGLHVHAKWKVEVMNIVRVKSYAPKVEHLVLDLRCCPINSMNYFIYTSA